MRARETTVRDLFAGKTVYVTPTFQRPYAYAEEPARRLLAAAGHGGAPCFLGALVTRELASRPGYRKALLIDGNQRLMTLLVFLMALRDALRAPLPEKAASLDALCFVLAGADAPCRFKNIVTARDRAAFEEAATGRPFPDPRHPLAKAYASGRESFAHLPAARLDDVAQRLLSDFTFVVFALAADDDPYPVFKLFNPSEDEATRVGRDTYSQFSRDPELMDLIAGGESQEVEFKAHSIVKGPRAREEGAHGVGTVVRAVAAMLNSATGGTILIGVEDDGKICGVEGEYPLADRGKGNWDGYLLHLANTLRGKLAAKNAFLHYAVERRQAGGHDVCMIRVTPAGEPVYVDKRLYVRAVNQTVEMLGPDLIDYVARRFPGAAR